MADDDRPTKIARGREAAAAIGAIRCSVIEGPDRGASYTMAGERCSIGSHESNDLRLGDATVSRFHCELVRDPRGLRVRDLESKNGTAVDGTRVIDGFARDGSVLVLGGTWVRVELGPPAAAGV